jgi:hypothetical protein
VERIRKAKEEDDERLRKLLKAAELKEEQEKRCAHVYVGKTFKGGLWKYTVLSVSPSANRVIIASDMTGSQEFTCDDIPR